LKGVRVLEEQAHNEGSLAEEEQVEIEDQFEEYPLDCVVKNYYSALNIFRLFLKIVIVTFRKILEFGGPKKCCLDFTYR